jgi:hypothetical protein
MPNITTKKFGNNASKSVSMNTNIKISMLQQGVSNSATNRNIMGTKLYPCSS